MGGDVVIQDVKLSQIVPSPFNRRVFPAKIDAELQSLADNIDEVGVQQPVLLRPLKGDFQLVFGERRWRASKLSQKHRDSIPAIVRAMDDSEARKLVITENLHRVNLHPLEEADGLQELLDNGWTLDEAATQLGKSVKFIARRAQLTKLSDKWRKAIADENKAVSHWSAAKLELIARFPADIQDSLLESHFRYRNDWDVQDLRRELASLMHLINLAPWKEDDETVDVKAGACSACPKRSDRQPELFDSEDLGKPGKKSGPCAACLDADCWGRKTVEFLKRKDAELTAEHGHVVIIGDYYTPDEFEKRKVNEYDVQTCKKTDPGAVPALTVSGQHVGQVKWIKPQSKSNGPGRLGSKPIKGAADKTLADRKLEYARLRGRIVTGLLVEKLDKYSKTKDEFVGGHEAALALILAFGTKERRDIAFDYGGSPWTTYKKHAALRLPELLGGLVRSTALVLAARLRNTLHNTDYKPDNDKAVCEFFRWSYDELFAEATKLKPDPKAWTKLEADEKAAKGKGKKVSTGEAKTKPTKAKKVRAGVCQYCGCTEKKACPDDGSGKPCHWINAEKTICSACEGESL